MVFGAQDGTQQQQQQLQLACVSSHRRAARSTDQMANQRRHAVSDVIRHPIHERDRDIPERRDWANLPPDLAAEIAGKLLGIDLTEYIRFRAVCKPWRRSTDDPRGGLDSRFFPRNWVMLSKYSEDTRCVLLNVATGASIVGDFPELCGQHPIGCTEGLLVLSNTTLSVVRFFNPLTRAITDLPGLSSLSSTFINALMAVTEGVLSIKSFGVIDGGDTAAPPTVVIFLSAQVPMLAFIRLGEPHWALVDTSEVTCRAYKMSVLSLHGRFYLSTCMGDVLTVDLHPGRPRLVYVIRQTATLTATALSANCSFQLAPSGNDDRAGMLMVMVRVRPGGEDEDDHTEALLFEVDVDGRKLVRKSTVGADRGRALFIGSIRSLSISTRLFPSIAASANAVYFCHGSLGMLFHVVYIDDGRTEPMVELEFSDMRKGRGPFVGPFNLDVYLASCADFALGSF